MTHYSRVRMKGEGCSRQLLVLEFHYAKTNANTPQTNENNFLHSSVLLSLNSTLINKQVRPFIIGPGEITCLRVPTFEKERAKKTYLLSLTNRTEDRAAA